MANNELQPKSVDQKQLTHDYEVLPNGDVKVTQVQELEFIWDSREFMSLYRTNEKALEEFKKQQSEDHLKHLKEQEEKILKEQAKLKPVLEESEKLAKVAYEKSLVEGMSQQLRAAINDKEVKEQWWVQIWNRSKDERKNQVLEKLTAEEKSKYLKIIQKLKRKGLIK